MSTGVVEDAYPTRTGAPVWPTERRDPVVHPGGDGPLTADQLERFDRDGFLAVDRLVGPGAAARLCDEVERLATDDEVARSGRVVLEPDGDAVRSIFEVHLLSPMLGRLIADRRLVGMAEQLLGSPVYVHQSRVNRKPAFDGDGFAWHSDFETWHAEDGMPTPRAVSLSLALTPNYVHNGSLLLIPGSHRTYLPTSEETPEDHYRQSLRRQEVGVPRTEGLTMLAERGGGITVVTGDAGSAVLFDSNAMHGSAENITPYPRTNLFVVYNSVDNRLEPPYAAPAPRPEFIASRQGEQIRAVDGDWDD